MLKQKSCPRCKNGNVAIDRDHYGRYEYCIQCGYMRDLGNTVQVKQQAWDGTEMKARVGILNGKADHGK